MNLNATFMFALLAVSPVLVYTVVKFFTDWSEKWKAPELTNGKKGRSGLLIWLIVVGYAAAIGCSVSALISVFIYVGTNVDVSPFIPVIVFYMCAFGILLIFNVGIVIRRAGAVVNDTVFPRWAKIAAVIVGAAAVTGSPITVVVLQTQH